MNPSNRLKNFVLFTCLFAGPFFLSVGDALWLTRHYNYSWNIWREASCIFFVPAGFLFAKLGEKKNFKWAMMACALYIIGCFGGATMMSLFRLGAFYPIHGHNEFPAVVQSVLGQKSFGATLFLPGLCFPVSLVLFGVFFLKYGLLNWVIGIAFIVSGIFFWMGNALEIDSVLIIGDIWLLLTFCYAGYIIYKDSIALPLREMATSINF